MGCDIAMFGDWLHILQNFSIPHLAPYIPLLYFFSLGCARITVIAIGIARNVQHEVFGIVSARSKGDESKGNPGTGVQWENELVEDALVPFILQFYIPWPYVPGLHWDSKIASGLHGDS